MRKLFVFLLLCIIAGLGVFCVFRYYANAPQQANWFNERYRAKLARYPFVRTVLNLRWDGDGRTDYLLSTNFKKIRIEYDRDDGCTIPTEALDAVTTAIEKATGKPNGVELIEGDMIPLAKDDYSASEIRSIAQTHQQFRSQGDVAALYLLCLNASSEESSHVGTTVFEDGIVIFWRQIQVLSEGQSGPSERYFVSTALHEFGHQLGLPHSDDPSCLMANIEATTETTRFWHLIPEAYCSSELTAIETTRQSLYNK